MNRTDSVYLRLLNDIMTNGVMKDTRAGRAKSIFGAQLRFDLKDGFPLLTTKKVFTKGIIYELLWFLQRYNSHGSMNIEYLIRNGVHIWDDDAYRWFKNEIAESFSKNPQSNKFMVCVNDDEVSLKKGHFEYWIENEVRKNDVEWLKNITKEEFLDLTLQKVEIWGSFMSRYRFGDLGPIYGKQWRCFGGMNYVDQIQNIIDTLKTNPNDRRMLCVAYNPDQIEDMALPPCHVMMQFYTRELTENERWEVYRKRFNIDLSDKNDISREVRYYNDATSPYSPRKYKKELNKELDEKGIPTLGLSCMFNMRSVDVCCGLPFNIASYGLLTHMIASVVGMEPDMLIASLGDCHIYENHFDGVKEQLKREGDDLPILRINRKVDSIDDFKYDDFEIVRYNPDPPIKYELNVG